MSTKPTKYLVVTEDGRWAGATIDFILKNTPANVSKIVIEDRVTTSHRPLSIVKRWLKKVRRLGQHLRLAVVMPGYYSLLSVQRLTGRDPTDCLAMVQRFAPAMLPIFCRFPVSRELLKEVRLGTVPQIASQHGIPIIVTPDLNSEETIQAIYDEAPDVVIGTGTRILNPELLESATIGFLNCHASLLPEYRGGVTEFWQLAAGETETGVTIHWMESNVDTGAIFCQRKWEIPKRSHHHRLRLMSMFYRLDVWREVIDRIENGDIRKIHQGKSKTPTYRKPTLKTECDFYCRGIKIEPRSVSRKPAKADEGD